MVIDLIREKSKANTSRFSANTIMNRLPRVVMPKELPPSENIEIKQKIVEAMNVG